MMRMELPNEAIMGNDDWNACLQVALRLFMQYAGPCAGKGVPQIFVDILLDASRSVSPRKVYIRLLTLFPKI